MNTITNTVKPKLKLNLATKPLALNTNTGSLVTGPTLKKVVVFEKPKESVTSVGNSPATSDKKDVFTAATKDSSKTVKKSKKQDATASNKKAVNEQIVPTPSEILKEKIKRRKKEYFSILTKLQTDFPALFSEEPKPLAIGIDLELKKILNGLFPNNQLGRFFHRYCGSFKYKEKLLEGAQRFNLDGSPASLVTKEEVPVMVSKPRFVKKTRGASNAPANVSNVIEHQHNE